MLAQWDGERDLTDWEYPDRWLGDGIDIALQTRTLRVIATPGPHRRARRLPRPRRRRAVRRRPRAAAHHAVDRRRTRPSRVAAARLPHLAAARAGHAGCAAAARARSGDRVDARPRRRAARASRGTARPRPPTPSPAAPTPAFAVAGVLGWTRRQRRFDELDMFNQILAIHETVAHLEVLVERGWLTRTDRRTASRTTRAPERQTAATTAATRCGDLVGLLLRSGLDHHPHQLLGAGRAQQDAAVVAEFCDALSTAAATDGDAATATPIVHRHVDQRLRQPRARRRRARPATSRSRPCAPSRAARSAGRRRSSRRR